MPTLNFNGQSYDLDLLSADARTQVTSIQFVDAEVARLKSQQAVLQTARNAYLQTLLPHLAALNASLAIPVPEQIPQLKH